MKLSETLLLGAAVAFLIIGVHQTFTAGILQSYWIFMLTIGLLLFFKLKRNSSVAEKAGITQKKQSAPVSKMPVKNKKRNIRK